MSAADDFADAALLLCAHGRGGAAEDHHIPELLARALRDTGRFARVDACYLRGRPAVKDVLAAVTEARVFLVPLLMADGYTNRVLLPEALAEAGGRAERVVATPPLGTAHGMTELVAADALTHCRQRGWAPGSTTVVIAGHGTARHTESARSAEEVAARLAASGRFLAAVAAFLEQAPFVETALRGIRPAPCVIVGFFLDRGGHSAEDIPRLIAMAHPDAAYGGPLGANPALPEIVLDLVGRAAANGGRA